MENISKRKQKKLIKKENKKKCRQTNKTQQKLVTARFNIAAITTMIVCTNIWVRY